MSLVCHMVMELLSCRRSSELRKYRRSNITHFGQCNTTTECSEINYHVFIICLFFTPPCTYSKQFLQNLPTAPFTLSLSLPFFLSLAFCLSISLVLSLSFFLSLPPLHQLYLPAALLIHTCKKKKCVYFLYLQYRPCCFYYNHCVLLFFKTMIFLIFCTRKLLKVTTKCIPDLYWLCVFTGFNQLGKGVG